MNRRNARRIRAGIVAAQRVQQLAHPETFWLSVKVHMPGSLFRNDRLTLRAYMTACKRLAGKGPSA